MSSRDGNFYTKFRNEIAAGGATEAKQNQNKKLTTTATSVVVLGLLVWLGVKNPWSLVFVAGLIVSVFLHEVGHFWTARRSGMKVTQFYMGMGPRIFSFQRGEVEFGLRALPVGAFVRIVGMNNLDETIPYSPNTFTRHTNESNGIVNSAFAKIPIPLGKSGHQCNDTMDTYMIYQPPAERIRKLKVRIRYHNGALVNFGSLNYSFTLELVIFDAQINKKVNMYVPETVKFGGGHRY